VCLDLAGEIILFFNEGHAKLTGSRSRGEGLIRHSILRVSLGSSSLSSDSAISSHSCSSEPRHGGLPAWLYQ